MAQKSHIPTRRIAPTTIMQHTINVRSRRPSDLSDVSNPELPSCPIITTYDTSEKKSGYELLYESAQEQLNPSKKWEKLVAHVGAHLHSKKYGTRLVNALDETKQWSALHYAVFNNNTFVCNKLTDETHGDIRFRCDVNILTGNSENVLHIATRSNLLWQTLSLSNKSRETHGTKDNQPALIPSIICTLVDRGVDINHADDEGRTPLHLAVMENRLEFVKYLLKKGANLYAKTKLYGNVLHFTFIPNGQSSAELSAMFECITENLKNPTSSWNFAPRNLARMRTFDNWTPLVFAVSHPKVTKDIVQRLFQEMMHDGYFKLDLDKSDILQTQIFMAIAEVARGPIQSYNHLEPILDHCEIPIFNQFFHFACRYNNDGFLKWLIEYSLKFSDQTVSNSGTCQKINLNQPDHLGYTPLLTAVFYQSDKCVEHLLKNTCASTQSATTSIQSIKINQQNIDGENILHIAAKNVREKPLLDLIWDAIKAMNLAEKSDHNGNSPLHIAAANNREDICDRILKASTNRSQILSRKNNQGQTAAHIATLAVRRRVGPDRYYFDHFKKGKLNESKNTKEDSQTSNDNDDDYNFGLPILTLMWEKSDKNNLLGGLFERDADRQTCLHLAAAKGHQKIVEFLVEKVGIKIDAITDRRLTPLHLACQYGHGKVIAYLIEHGASATFRNAELYNSLEIAIMNQHKEVVRELLTLPNWRELMSNAQRIDNSEGYDTPMRKLIRYMPDVTIWMIEEKLTRTIGGQGKNIFKESI
ncbi:unnamed protein product [Adineta ricciae]|uniref:Uncharacterized protein n=1 Tax=Adineta ricciae TaxID=249248 RepID=A0A815EJ70_ADIRI|nr:unnamed protein product [Adineta ricciae]CAF1509543.1 unnamed protein product [Adineta ricciae]